MSGDRCTIHDDLCLVFFDLDYYRTGNSRILLESSLKRISIKCVHAFIFWVLYMQSIVSFKKYYTQPKGKTKRLAPPPVTLEVIHDATQVLIGIQTAIR